MSKRLVMMCLVLFVLVIGGCGGGGGAKDGNDAPLLIPGKYYPLTVGTTWAYDTVFEVETASDLFTTTGTFTRKLTSHAPVNVAGKVYNAYRFDQAYTAAATPVLRGTASRTVAPAVAYLFSKTGGLHPVTAYYVSNPAAVDSPANVMLIALSEGGGPVMPVRSPQPILMTPPYRGTAKQFSTQFIHVPLLPPSAAHTNLTVRNKLLDYDDVVSINGPAHAVIDIYYFESDVNLGGTVGQLGGRGRSFFVDGLGFASSTGGVCDWSGTLQVKNQWARITVRMTLKSMG